MKASGGAGVGGCRDVGACGAAGCLAAWLGGWVAGWLGWVGARGRLHAVGWCAGGQEDVSATEGGRGRQQQGCGACWATTLAPPPPAPFPHACPTPTPTSPPPPPPPHPCATGAMHPLGSEVVKACLPGGQRKPFRHNMMALMTVTGAKGSVVNFSQVGWQGGAGRGEGGKIDGKAAAAGRRREGLARQHGSGGMRARLHLRAAPHSHLRPRRRRKRRTRRRGRPPRRRRLIAAVPPRLPADLVPAGAAGAGGAARAAHEQRQDAALLRALRRGRALGRLCGRPLPHRWAPGRGCAVLGWPLAGLGWAQLSGGAWAGLGYRAAPGLSQAPLCSERHRRAWRPSSLPPPSPASSPTARPPLPPTHPPQACAPRNITSTAWRGGRGWWTQPSRRRDRVRARSRRSGSSASASASSRPAPQQRHPPCLGCITRRVPLPVPPPSCAAPRISSPPSLPPSLPPPPSSSPSLPSLPPSSPRRLPAAVPGEEPGESQGALRLNGQGRLRLIHRAGGSLCGGEGAGGSAEAPGGGRRVQGGAGGSGRAQGGAGGGAGGGRRLGGCEARADGGAV